MAILGTRDTHHRHQLPVRTRRKRAGSVFDRDLAQCSESGCGVFVVYSMSSGKKKLDANLGRFLFRQLVKVLLWRAILAHPFLGQGATATYGYPRHAFEDPGILTLGQSLFS